MRAGIGLEPLGTSLGPGHAGATLELKSVGAGAYLVLESTGMGPGPGFVEHDPLDHGHRGRTGE